MILMVGSIAVVAICICLLACDAMRDEAVETRKLQREKRQRYFEERRDERLVQRSLRRRERKAAKNKKK